MTRAKLGLWRTDLVLRHLVFAFFGKPIQVKDETKIKIVKTACTLYNWLRFTMPNTYTPQGIVDYDDE